MVALIPALALTMVSLALATVLGIVFRLLCLGFMIASCPDFRKAPKPALFWPL
jgi:hypothetical protein